MTVLQGKHTTVLEMEFCVLDFSLVTDSVFRWGIQMGLLMGLVKGLVMGLVMGLGLLILSVPLLVLVLVQ